MRVYWCPSSLVSAFCMIVGMPASLAFFSTCTTAAGSTALTTMTLGLRAMQSSTIDACFCGSNAGSK